jgi:hypothetical protein
MANFNLSFISALISNLSCSRCAGYGVRPSVISLPRLNGGTASLFTALLMPASSNPFTWPSYDFRIGLIFAPVAGSILATSFNIWLRPYKLMRCSFGSGRNSVGRGCTWMNVNQGSRAKQAMSAEMEEGEPYPSLRGTDHNHHHPWPALTSSRPSLPHFLSLFHGL